MLQFKLSAIRPHPSSRGAGFYQAVLLGRAAIFGHEQDNVLKDSSRLGYSCAYEDGREQPTSQLYTCLEAKVIEIRDFLQWCVSSRQIHEDLCVPLFADHVRALTANFDPVA